MTADFAGTFTLPPWTPQVTGTYTIRLFAYPTQFINTMNPDMEVLKSTVATLATATITVSG